MIESRSFRNKAILFAIVLKLSISFLLLIGKGYPDVALSNIVCTGDCEIAYLPAAENLVAHGQYTIYSNLAPYAGRIPGYELLMAGLMFLFGNASVAFLLLLIIQSVLAGISTFYLAKIARMIFKIDAVFFIVFISYGMSTYVSLLDIKILTESLTISLFIIAFGWLLSESKQHSSMPFLFIGLILTFCFILRQYTLPFFLLWLAYLIYDAYRLKMPRKLIIKRSLLFLFPLILFEACWIVRNYNQQQKFIPLVDSLYAGYDSPNAKEEGFYFSDAQKALANYIKSWGGDFIWWNPNAEITAFFSSPPKSKEAQLEVLRAFPEYIYTEDYGLDSLLSIQAYFNQESLLQESEVVEKLNTYRSSFEESKPFQHIILAPLKLFGKFIFHSGTYNLFDDAFAKLSAPKKLIKLFYSSIYYLVVIGGFLGIMMIVLKSRDAEKGLLVINAIYIIILLCVIIRRIEFRHLAFSYPFLLVLGSYFYYEVITRLRNKFAKSRTFQE